MLIYPRWKMSLVTILCALGILYALPNFLPQSLLRSLEGLPAWAPVKQINLGLDLQGGSHLLLQVELDAVLAEQMESTLSTVRRELRGQKIGYRNLRVLSGKGAESAGPVAEVTIRKPSDFEKAKRILNNIDNALVLEGLEGGRFRLALTAEERKLRGDRIIANAIEVVRRRVDETGTREPNIQQQGANRILLQLPGIDDPEGIKSLLGKTAKLSFHIEVYPSENGSIPATAKRLQGAPDARQDSYIVERRAMVSGEHLVDSQPSFQDGAPIVTFRFDSVGAKKFGKATSEHVGQPMAIVLDDQVISAPRINDAILGGSGIITGGFTVEAANELALLLRSGALPAPLIVLEERSVGPGLGQDSVNAGRIASLIAFAAVTVFMFISYGRFGMFANLALVINVTLIIAILSLLQATLTLPGIAGIVLTIGMAVDANVLIFERIREEIAAKKPVYSAIEQGFSRALTTILDSNITTVIAALMLYGLGSGPVRGFGITLVIGILTSMFSAIMVTRMLIVIWVRSKKPRELVL